LSCLKQRVLQGETLNQFKKETVQLAELIDKKDPAWNSSFSQVNAQKLAAVLQKPNYHEMLYMLQRTSLLERRKRKRNDLDKHVATFRSKIDVDLKLANKKSEQDYVDLEKLSVEEAKVKFDFNVLLPELQSLVKEYVALNNEYVQVKAAEERLKTKRVKDPKPAPETLEVPGELEKCVETIVQ